METNQAVYEILVYKLGQGFQTLQSFGPTGWADKLYEDYTSWGYQVFQITETVTVKKIHRYQEPTSQE